MDEKKVVNSKPIAVIFLTLFSSLLFIALLTLILLYVKGNYQDFLDENLILILKASVAVSIVLFFISSVSFFVDVYLFAMQRRFLFLLTFLISFLFVIVSVLFAIGCTLIIVIS